MNARVANRLPAETHDLVFAGNSSCRVSLARDPETGVPVELVLKPTGTAGKSGGTKDIIFADLDVAMRFQRGRDPTRLLGPPAWLTSIAEIVALPVFGETWDNYRASKVCVNEPIAL
jgi:hypothetical protein